MFRGHVLNIYAILSFVLKLSGSLVALTLTLTHTHSLIHILSLTITHHTCSLPVQQSLQPLNTSLPIFNSRKFNVHEPNVIRTDIFEKNCWKD